MDSGEILEIARECASAVVRALAGLEDWGPARTRPGQYRSDLVADEAALGVLIGAGLGVLSEESGTHGAGRPLLAVVDPLDGSTNAARGVPWFATSICVLDEEGPLVAVVENLASSVRYEAVRGGGAKRDGRVISPSSCETMRNAFVGLSGFPRRHLGWRQYRALGAAALDLCAVADGTLDAWVDTIEVTNGGAHGAWDYLGGYLVCREAGAVVVDALGRDLVVREHGVKRTPVAAGTAKLLVELVEARGRG